MFLYDIVSPLTVAEAKGLAQASPSANTPQAQAAARALQAGILKTKEQYPGLDAAFEAATIKEIRPDGTIVVHGGNGTAGITRLMALGGGAQFKVVADQGMAEDFGDSPVTSAITRRILSQRLDLLKQYGPELVGAAVDNVADYVGDVEEIGSSDVSAWVAQVERMLKENPPEAFDQDMEEGVVDTLKGAWEKIKDFDEPGRYKGGNTPGRQALRKKRELKRKEKQQGVAEAIPLDTLRSTAGTRVKDEVSAKLKQNGPLGRDAEKAKQNGKPVKPGVAEGSANGMRLLAKYEEGQRAVKVYKNAEWNEYVVQYYDNGQRNPEADYHTDDKQDAIDSASSYLKKGIQDMAEGLGYSQDPDQAKWYHAGRKAYKFGTTGDLIQDIAKKHGCPPEWLKAFHAGYQDQEGWGKQDVEEAGYNHGFPDPNAPSLNRRRREDDEGNSEFDDRQRRQTGMIFYKVDDADLAQQLGLKQTRTGKWYLRTGNRHAQQSADRAFGLGRIWYPKNETVESQELGELSNELLGRYKKELGVRASAADRAGDYDRGHEYFKKITKATIRQGDNDARRHAEKENDMMETRLNMMRKAGYDL